MSRLVYEGRTNVYWATAVANKNSPTVAEVTAATALTNFVTKDGVRVNITSNKVDNATIAETFNAQNVGSDGADLELEMFRDDTADTAWNLAVKGTNGFVIIDRVRVAGVLPSAGNKVEVYPAQMGRRMMNNSAQDENQRFVLQFAVTANYNENATVA